ncbi:hypothetical protein hrd7_31210 [Leptolinea sp. HRD-7]|nr:hypothetical protein hrd7_31210 [Leptolinea sp. HRD-7]
MFPLSARHFRYIWYGAFFLLTACSTVADPAFVTPAAFRVEVSPTLEYLSPAITACSMQYPELQLILEEKPSGDMGKTGAAVSLFWGESTIPSGVRVYRLGADRLVYAVHKSNPLQKLTFDQALLVDRGSFTSWADVYKSFCPDCTAAETFLASPVEVWRYSPGSDVYAGIAGLSPDAINAPFGRIWLAPSARTLSEIITNNPAAIGWLPYRWLNENLKEISLEEIDPGRQVIPVIAVTPGDPEPVVSHWLKCLQSSFGN